MRRLLRTARQTVRLNKPQKYFCEHVVSPLLRIGTTFESGAKTPINAFRSHIFVFIIAYPKKNAIVLSQGEKAAPFPFFAFYVKTNKIFLKNVRCLLDFLLFL